MAQRAFSIALVALAAACSGSPSSPGTPSNPPSDAVIAPANKPPASASAAPEAPPAKPRAGKIEEFPSQGGNARAYIATPSTAGKHPAILVIQEFWGMNEWIMDDADRFASQGYVAAAVDLYRGKVAATADVAHELMRALDEPRGLADLKAAFEALAKRPDVDPTKIGAIGWCMGGGYAITFASTEPRLKAVVMNYGHLLTQPQAIDAIKMPLLGNFGGKDNGIPPNEVDAFAAKVRDKNKDVDVKIYPSSGHAFMNPNNKTGYVDADAQDAWKRIDAFFKAKLNP